MIGTLYRRVVSGSTRKQARSQRSVERVRGIHEHGRARDRLVGTRELDVERHVAGAGRRAGDVFPTEGDVEVAVGWNEAGFSTHVTDPGRQPDDVDHPPTARHVLEAHA